MANTIVEATFDIANSLFAIRKERVVSRRYPPKYTKLPRDFEHHLKFHHALQRYLSQRGVGSKAIVTNNVDLIRALADAAFKPSAAWEWLLDQFETSHPDFLQDPQMQMAASFARGRIASLQEAEARQEIIAASRQAARSRTYAYAVEKAENGGDDEFFNSNKWQRLRYEVLSASNGCCCLCGRSCRDHGVALEVDHIKPRSRFPNLAMEKENLQVLCFDCNRGKGNRCTIDWRSDSHDHLTAIAEA